VTPHPPDVTCWTLIRDAASGDAAARDRFARVYLSVVRAYLGSWWGGVIGPPDVDDAAQDVFVECFRAGGVLERADPNRATFRAFLLGAARNVARRHEARKPFAARLPANLPADDTSPAAAFDRAWARALLREAGRIQQVRAGRAGPAAARRVQLLWLRFGDGLPIRDIAARWGDDPARLHHEYALARDEFRAALREAVAFHDPAATAGEIDRACESLVSLVG
jgi:RNA polymerase sigma-70 factor (ECF subfamily)